MNVLFQLSGSIACYKACQVISQLTKQGHEVQVAATAAALKFVGKATLEGLTGKPVFSDTYAEGQMMDHIHLMRRADKIILCPATANTVNQMANGIANDCVGTLFLAHDFKKPYLVAPAMNQSMYLHPTTQRSLRLLDDWGIQILKPDEGQLACGEEGPGRLMEPEKILQAIEAAQ